MRCVSTRFEAIRSTVAAKKAIKKFSKTYRKTHTGSMGSCPTKYYDIIQDHRVGIGDGADGLDSVSISL